MKRSALLASALGMLPVCGVAGGPDSFALRYGVGASPGTAAFDLVEAAAGVPLPYARDLGERWTIDARFEFALGHLSERGTESMLVRFGPLARLEREGLPVAIEFGISPTLLERHRFPARNLGVAFQFTSHAGITSTGDRVRLGYRFQHTSNARIDEINPGLNMHVFSLVVLFD